MISDRPVTDPESLVVRLSAPARKAGWTDYHARMATLRAERATIPQQEAVPAVTKESDMATAIKGKTRRTNLKKDVKPAKPLTRPIPRRQGVKDAADRAARRSAAAPRAATVKAPKPATKAKAPAGDVRPVAPGTKTETLVNLLQRDKGANLEQICKATGWLPHSARAAISQLGPKHGLTVKTEKTDGVTIYSLPA